jgi:hypothetical protein
MGFQMGNPGACRWRGDGGVYGRQWAGVLVETLVTGGGEVKKKVEIEFRMDPKMVARLGEIAKLAGVSLSTAVSVMLATFVLTQKESP